MCWCDWTVRSEARVGAIQHKHLVKMHSAGELTFDLLRDSHTQVIKSKKSLPEIQTGGTVSSSSTAKVSATSLVICISILLLLGGSFMQAPHCSGFQAEVSNICFVKVLSWDLKSCCSTGIICFPSLQAQ